MYMSCCDWIVLANWYPTIDEVQGMHD
jgi:hypothetical protein